MAKEFANLIVTNASNEVLFLKRCSTDGFEPSKWCVPGGHKEPGETALQAAIRETLEETGIKIDRTAYNPRFLGKITNEGGVHFYFEYYDVNYPEVVLDSQEHQNYCWMPILKACEQLEFLKTMGQDICKFYNHAVTQ